ncbi:CRISPR-associated endoribonuclease Cas6 [Tepidibacillus fermentans]|uniref:CRISPR-associated endoribonuclease Cas6 n=2 Tax=Tepidibacillus fermentans TaxID=1281767 RepID=A0A4R3K7G4_9BACI|nr:CRISPR-associated endoribonuclease Cas6 [Tepidibacillus fermentans]
MLSPITVYSTYLRENGQKHTMYYTPKDEMFYQLIEENLKKKYEAYTGKTVVGTFTIKPKKIRENDKVVTRFKGFIINAWNGVYELEGNPELINFAYQVGLSNRNSQGFGMFQVI